MNVVAHELAHSWTGNLVTNANAEHFWLNEGFTVFAERRILEALEGAEVAALHAALGRRALETALEHFQTRPAADRAAHAPCGDRSGRRLLAGALREGLPVPARPGGGGGARRPSTRSCSATSTRFRFRALTTEECVAFTERELPGVLGQVGAEEYLHEPGIPGVAPSPRSRAAGGAAAPQGHGALGRGGEGRGRPPSGSSSWSGCPRTPHGTAIRTLDERFHLTQSTNSEVLVAWLVAALRAHYAPALARAGDFLGEVGRMKYLKPLYSTLHGSKEYRGKARELFQKYAERYHPIARQGIEGILSRP